MLASITPLGERGRQRSWRTTAIAYAIGSVMGGGTTGALLGALGSTVQTTLRPAAGWILAIGLLLVALFELGWLPVELPTIERQVNEDWLDEYRGWVVGVGFGFQLGAALVTIVTSPSVYLTFVAGAMTGSIAAGAVVGAVFGLARALPLLVVRHVTTPQSLASVHNRMASLAGVAHFVVAGGVAALAVFTLGVA